MTSEADDVATCVGALALVAGFAEVEIEEVAGLLPLETVAGVVLAAEAGLVTVVRELTIGFAVAALEAGLVTVVVAGFAAGAVVREELELTVVAGLRVAEEELVETREGVVVTRVEAVAAGLLVVEVVAFCAL